MSRRKPLPRALSSEPFAVAEALRLGVSEDRLRHPEFVRPFRGVRELANRGTAQSTDPWELRAADLRRRTRAFAVRMSPHHAFSHVTAAELLMLRLPGRLQTGTAIDVGSVAPARALRAAGVRRHELLARTPLTQSAEGLQVTSPIETWIALASVLRVDELIVLGDGLVCRKNPIATVDQLEEAVECAKRRPGVKKLRRAMLEIRQNTDSARETLLRLMLVRAGLPEPEINGELVNEYGAFVAFGDILYRKERVLVEYDGGGHRQDEKQFHRDINRLDDVMELDFRVIRVNKDLMERPAVLLRKVRDALERRSPVANRDLSAG